METKFDKGDILPTFFEDISSSLSFCNKALSELNLMENIIHTEEEREILTNYTFDFYKLSVKYCFNNEYCKIFANLNASNESATLSSLVSINNYIYKQLGGGFESDFTNNTKLISSIIESSFCKNQLLLKHKNNVDSMINNLTYTDVQIGFQHLNAAAKMIKNYAGMFGLDYNINIPNINTSTIDFVMDHSVFKQFYLDSHLRTFD